MSLSPLTRKARKRRILTYDLEWYPETYALRLAVLYDGERYHIFHSIDEFLSHCLRPEYSGSWIFAHYGGRFDFNFILQALLAKRYSISLVFSGSSAVRVEISDGRREWSFCDSQFLLQGSLKAIGKSIGLAKIDCKFDAPIEELTTYCQRDCLILYRAITWLEEVVFELGGELQRTLAATCLGLFRRAYQKDVLYTSRGLNEEIRPGYVAGRVEVFQHRHGSGSCYDINSSFPFSMENAPLPGGLRKTDFTLSDMCVARAKVHVPRGLHVAPLPYRVNGTLLFPTGTFEGWFCSADFEVLEESGGYVVEVYKSHHFESITWFGEYVRHIYGMRENETDPFRSLVLKLLLNCLYGKFAEREERSIVVVNPKSLRCPHQGVHDTPNGASCVRRIPGLPNCIIVDSIDKLSHPHLPIPMTVTSRSRGYLYRGLEAAVDVANCDTDAIWSKSDFGDSKKLGDWKKEYDYHSAIFQAPKAYSLWAYNRAKEEPDGWIVKCKGFPKLTREDFIRLSLGERMALSRMRGLRGTLKKGLGDDLFEKGFAISCGLCGSSIGKSGACKYHGRGVALPHEPGQPKRIWEGDTISRPYDIQKDL